jgi:ComF family protein
LTLAKMLGQLLARHIPAGDGSRLVPVPLHKRRLRQRGFNQAAEIARPLQRRDYQLDTRNCTRSRHTPPQSELAAEMRLDNLRDAFTVQHDVSGESIVLVDDVMTTGATLNALAGVLKRAGAARIEAWVIARTPEPGPRQRSAI